MPLTPAFQLHLRNSILVGRATVGKFDGVHPALACATAGGKIFLHSPYDTEADDAPLASGAAASGAAAAARNPHGVRFLNINRQVSALGSGSLQRPGAGGGVRPDALLIGTPTNLLAYDVHANADLFFKEVPDGVSCVAVGTVAGVTTSSGGSTPASASQLVPLAVVGGNCSLQGFDATGQELYWSVTGDNVATISFVDVDHDGNAELVVGSDDFDIRVFRGEEVVAEVTETAKIRSIVPMALGATRSGARFPASSFGYALENGTVGIYEDMNRVWRVKSKHAVNALLAFDLDADGDPEIISGWSTGKVEARRRTSGELVYRDTSLTAAVAALLRADYRLDGRDVLMVCATDGEVAGYLPVEAESIAAALDTKGADDKALAQLQDSRAALEMELRAIESSITEMKSGSTNALAIPATTRLTVSALVDAGVRGVRLNLMTNNESVIKTAVVYSLEAAVFDGESLVVSPKAPSNLLSIPVRIPRDGPVNLRIQAMVGARGSGSQFVVFEREHSLPRFSMYRRATRALQAALAGTTDIAHGRLVIPTGYVKFIVADRPERVALWIANSFLVDDREMATITAPPPSHGGVVREKQLTEAFVVMRSATSDVVNAAPSTVGSGGIPIIIETKDVRRPGAGPAGATASGIEITIRCDDVDTAGDLLQDLASYLGLQTSTGGSHSSGGGGGSGSGGGTPVAGGAGGTASISGGLGASTASAAGGGGAGSGGGGGGGGGVGGGGLVVMPASAASAADEVVTEWSFPLEMEAFRALLHGVDEANAIRMRLSAEVADSSNVIKALVIRAEDARMLGDMAEMRRHYSQLMSLNSEMLAEHAKRQTNHQRLLEALRQVNAMIQKVARLRIGHGKTLFINACRNAMKLNNTEAVFAIVSTGNLAPGLVASTIAR